MNTGSGDNTGNNSGSNPKQFSVPSGQLPAGLQNPFQLAQGVNMASNQGQQPHDQNAQQPKQATNRLEMYQKELEQHQTKPAATAGVPADNAQSAAETEASKKRKAQEFGLATVESLTKKHFGNNNPISANAAANKAFQPPKPPQQQQQQPVQAQQAQQPQQQQQKPAEAAVKDESIKKTPNLGSNQFNQGQGASLAAAIQQGLGNPMSVQNFMNPGLMPGMAIGGMGLQLGNAQSQQMVQGLQAQNSMLASQVQNMANTQGNQNPFAQTPILVQTTPQPNANNQRQLKVEDALAYLDKVKTQFGNQPMVYNRFLEIMKNFKAQNIDTPEVIRRVSELFQGHNNLILGFNTFLPPGYKIELPKKQTKAKGSGTGRGRGGRGRGSKNVAPLAKKVENKQPLGVKPGGSAPANLSNAASSGRDEGARKNGKASVPAPDTAGEAKQHSQPVEFDHAINYVTKIKRRFSSDADTYKKFLDILHTYQKEQRSIKQVLDQVSSLFKDHSDLLKEFTYFLPDAVREEAKEELAKRSKQAKAIQRAQARAVKRAKKAPERDEAVRVPQLERNLLGRIKSALVTRELWGEFIKCLDLFAQKLISRADLLSLASDIFPPGKENLLEEFDRLLASRGATDNVTEEAWFSMPLSEIDFSNCTRCTPSYRKLPASFPKAPCSERTAMCRNVLNDTWVSVPTGSEDFTFKAMRKNQYEEALFKCEDDRYEIDMVIDSNQAAMRALEPLAREIKALGLNSGKTSRYRYRLEKRTLSVIHLKAIARIYGDHGTDILELLRRNPAGAIPIVLKRLKQKDEEWRAARVELNKGWKETLEKNYYKSLDHKSFYFKQSDKKDTSAKYLVADIKDKHKNKLAEKGTLEGDDRFAMECKFEDMSVHKDVWAILCYAVEKQTDDGESADKVASVWANFIHPLFNMPKQWLSPSTNPRECLVADAEYNPKTLQDAIPQGTKVMTPWGLGTIQDAYNVTEARYTVELEWGVATLRPRHVTIESSFSTKPDELSKPLAVQQDTEVKPETYYGSTSAYLFFRLYHVLYTRLARAKKLSSDPSVVAKKTHKHPRDRTEEEKVTLAYDGEVEYASAKENAYEMILALLYSLLSGSLESSKFEDECRNLLGSASYFLYTAERVVQGCVKQLLLLINDTKTMGVISAMEEYKASLSAATMAKVYQLNNTALLEQDGGCYGFEFTNNVLKIALFDNIPVTTEAPQSESEYKDTKLVTVSPVQVDFQQQLNEAMATSTEGESTTTAPFLQRNVQSEGDAGKVEQKQGLRMQLALPLYRIVYLPGSEDVFRVIKQRSATKEAEKDRTEKFSQWWSAAVLPELVQTPEEVVEEKKEEEDGKSQNVEKEEKKEESKDAEAKEDKMQVD